MVRIIIEGNEKQIEVDEIFQEEIQLILERYSAQNTKLIQMPFSNLYGSFYIENYQRGYRWTKTEIEELLKDIKGLADEEGYCLQPLVVKNKTSPTAKYQLGQKFDKGNAQKMEISLERCYELIDGQQRLTTLWLVSEFLRESIGEDKAGKVKYDIYYQLSRRIDQHYICKAQQCIKEWFNNENVNKEAFCKKLKQLFFIWYEVKTTESSEDIFNSVNDGKVPLTNAELFKALLLDENKALLLDERRDLNADEAVKIAYEWDKIEGNLWDDDFWYFISNDHAEKKTRIDYLLDVYAKSITAKNQSLQDDLDFHKERFSYLTVQRHKEKERKNAKKIWGEIVEVYNKLYSWYKDDELYNTIGFLVASEEKPRNSTATANELICELYQECKDKNLSDVRAHVRGMIREKYFLEDIETNTPLTVDKVYYADENGQSDLKRVRAILLFHNVYTGYFPIVYAKAKWGSGETIVQRFPFKMYKTMDWDIEHIKPKELQDIAKASSEEKISAFHALLEEDDKLSDEQKETLKSYINGESNFDACKTIWNDYKQRHEAMHKLSNLVLLDAKINRGYGNAFFSRKRKDVIKYDVEGRFIPICTKRAFLKYYAKEEDKSCSYWTKSEQDKYENELKKMFKAIENNETWGKTDDE